MLLLECVLNIYTFPINISYLPSELSAVLERNSERQGIGNMILIKNRHNDENPQTIKIHNVFTQSFQLKYDTAGVKLHSFQNKNNY